MKTWEEKISASNVKFYAPRKYRRLFLERIDGLKVPDVNQDNFLNLILGLLSKLPNPNRSLIRHIVTRLYPTPNLNDTAEDLEIFIFTSEKDLKVLELSILGAIESSKNKLNLLTVVAPSSVEVYVQAVFLRIQKGTTLKFVSDESLLAKYSLGSFQFIRPNIKMEILKVLAVLSCNCDAALVIDGDTVLLNERVWINKDKQIVLVAQEYTPAHIEFDKRYLSNYESKGLGFVTHHQVIRRSHLEELISEKNGLFDFIGFFNSAATDFYSRSGREFPSEWQLFGDYLVNRHPNKVALASFRNLGMSRNNVSYFSKDHVGSASAELARLKEVVPSLASLSFHGYKD